MKTVKGFTLIEVMVSLAIIGSLIAVLSTLLYHLNIATEEEELLRAVLLAKEKCLDTPPQIDGEDSWWRGNSEWQDNSPEGPESPYEDLLFKRTVIDTPFPGIKLVRVTVLSGRDKRELVKMERFLRR